MLTIRAALALYAFAFAALLTVGARLSAYGLAGVAASEWLCVGAPTLVAVGLGAGRAIDVLRMRASAHAVLAAFLVGASAWMALAYGVLPVQEALAPTPPDLVEALERVAVPGGSPTLALLALAVTPAICEELLCRGVLLPALRKKLLPWQAVVVTAALFALLHFSPYRFLPTFLLGVSFGALAVATSSTLPSMIAHALNNTAVVLVSSSAMAPLREWLEGHHAAAVVAGVGVLTIGHLLVSRRRPSPDDH